MRFNKEELATMREFYPLMPSKEFQQKHLPERSLTWINGKARRMKLHKKMVAVVPALKDTRS
jgi:hypothetical protein